MPEVFDEMPTRTAATPGVGGLPQLDAGLGGDPVASHPAGAPYGRAFEAPDDGARYSDLSL